MHSSKTARTRTRRSLQRAGVVIRLFVSSHTLTSSGAVLILRVLPQSSTTSVQAATKGPLSRDITFSLPDVPTLLSAEGDFLSLAGSILGTHSAISNAGRGKRGQTGERKRTVTAHQEGSRETEQTKRKRRGKHTFSAV